MDKIETASGVSHAMTDRLDYAVAGKRRGKTRCGKTVVGRTGACIVALIDCKACKRSLRKDGWEI